MTKRISLLAAGVGIIALGACADPNYPTGELSNTQQGVIAGATAGAIIGAATAGGNRGRDAARGAIVGGLAGGAIGSALDAQQRALEAQMTTPGVRVVNTGQTLNVILPEGVLFAFDSAAVSGPAQADLRAVAANLRQYPNSTVQIIGHTDSTGAAAYNQQLSERRAQSVANILISGGVPANRLAVAGRGATQPIASNATESGRAQNRRVEIIIIPNR